MRARTAPRCTPGLLYDVVKSVASVLPRTPAGKYRGTRAESRIYASKTAIGAGSMILLVRSDNAFLRIVYRDTLS